MAGLGRADEARRPPRSAREVAERSGGLPLASAMAARAEAAVALHGGDSERAAEHAATAARLADAAAPGSRPRWRACSRRGRSAARTPSPSSSAPPPSSRACGARHHAEQAERELARVRGGRHPGRRDVQGLELLSRRELDVARLVVERHTNNEIAEKLFLSRKTVETHMSAVFRKLGVSSRVEVARMVERLERDAQDSPSQ